MSRSLERDINRAVASIAMGLMIAGGVIVTAVDVILRRHRRGR